MRDGCPDPLIYYLHAATLAHTQMIAAASGGADDVLPDPLDPNIAALLGKVTAWDVAEASTARLTAMLSGIDKWRAHPDRRDLPEPPAIWSSGAARALDYGKAKDGHPVLVVPSLINKPYILDLMTEASFLRRMANNGLRPVLLDWGDGTGPDKPGTIDDYMGSVLRPAFQHLARTTDTRPSLLGYCMGGTLATGLAAYLKDDVARLALIGAPWDFSKLKGVSLSLKRHIEQTGVETLSLSLEAMGHHFGAIPASMFQQLFAVLSPMQVVQKFSRFDRWVQTSPEARKFVAVEDWLADGTHVPADAARTILVEWYMENQTARGLWQVLGDKVDPGQITCPTMIVTGHKDHIVPTDVAAALVPLIANCAHVPVDMGHVGMIVGTRAHAVVADRISAFFDVR